MHYLSFAMIGIMPLAATVGAIIQCTEPRMSYVVDICYAIVLVSMLTFLLLFKFIENYYSTRKDES